MHKSISLLAAICWTQCVFAYDVSLATPVDPPYDYDFSAHGVQGFEEDWIVIDANVDGMQWEYSSWTAGYDGEMGVAVCYGSYMDDLTNDDYLVSRPVNLTAGDNFLSFSCRASYSDAVERLELFYTPTGSIGDMVMIGDIAIVGPEWQQHIYNYVLPADGAYCIAFRYCSVDGAMACVDNVVVGNGYMPTAPDLVISKLLLPVSNCDLSDAYRIGIVIKNIGTAPTESFDLKCDINRANGEIQTLEQHFTATIAPNESATLYFDHTADLSEIDDYEIVALGMCNGQEIEAFQGKVSALAPTDLPMVSNFSDGSMGEWVEIDSGSWTFDSFSLCIQGKPGGEEFALLSRCFEASGRLRMKICYGASAWTPGKLHVAIGKAGCDYSFYRTIYVDSDYFDTKEAEFEFDVDDLDHYCILIVNDDLDPWGQELLLKSIEISSVKDYDIAISQVMAALSPYTPIDQISHSTPIAIEICNRGLKDCEEVEIKAICNDEIIGSTIVDTTLKAGDKAEAIVNCDLSASSVDDKIDITIIADGEIADVYFTDNIAVLPTAIVTDYIRAVENISDFTLGVGNWGETIAIGNLFALACDDVLTAIEIGLCECDEIIGQEKEICVSVYEITADFHTLGRCLYSQTLRRGEGGLVRIDLDPMLLHAGNYYFEVAQLSNVNMGLAYDYSDGNFCHQRLDDRIEKIDNGLALAIRAIFEEANAPQHDVAPIAILNPSNAIGLYSDHQDISVSIKNLGSEDAVSTIVCYVNGQLYDEMAVSLLPYETTICDFYAVDMSQAGEYLVEVVSSSDLDENSLNDAISGLFIAQEEVSPYTMDFEYCSDFDGGYEIFNPRWRTIDRNNCATDGFWQYSYPYHSMPVGFIAFNPAITIPSMVENGLPGFSPHSGQRFGAAFATAPPFGSGIEHSDVWLISPKLKLGVGSALELFVKTRALEWENQPLEKYQILVSDTNDEYDSFHVIGPETREACAEAWEKVWEDLSAYDNREIFIAVRYIGLPIENVVLMVDDINVVTEIDSASDSTMSAIDLRYDNGAVWASASTPIESISVHNAYGQEIFSVSPNKESFKIDLSGYAPGLYLITASNHYSQSTLKILH